MEEIEDTQPEKQVQGLREAYERVVENKEGNDPLPFLRIKYVLDTLLDFYLQNGYGKFLQATDQNDTKYSQRSWRNFQTLAELLRMCDRVELARLVVYQRNVLREQAKRKEP